VLPHCPPACSAASNRRRLALSRESAEQLLPEPLNQGATEPGVMFGNIGAGCRSQMAKPTVHGLPPEAPGETERVADGAGDLIDDTVHGACDQIACRENQGEG